MCNIEDQIYASCPGYSTVLVYCLQSMQILEVYFSAFSLSMSRLIGTPLIADLTPEVKLMRQDRYIYLSLAPCLYAYALLEFETMDVVRLRRFLLHCRTVKTTWWSPIKAYSGHFDAIKSLSRETNEVVALDQP